MAPLHRRGTEEGAMRWRHYRRRRRKKAPGEGAAAEEGTGSAGKVGMSVTDSFEIIITNRFENYTDTRGGSIRVVSSKRALNGMPLGDVGLRYAFPTCG